MKAVLVPALLLLGMSVPALAQSATSRPTPVPPRAAPGPLMGAGLPVLLIGGGVYWLARRRRRKVTPEPSPHIS
jgi:LPXTG-motif cell wall-anchored protein